MQTEQYIIIGGGIAGLTAAYRLQKLAAAAKRTVGITVVERDVVLGGKVRTEVVDGFVIEAAPDCFLSRKAPGAALCAELGVLDQLQGRNVAKRKTFVKVGGQLHRLPEGLTGMIPTNLEALAESTLLSAAGQARLAAERTLPPLAAGADESVAAFVSRRLGEEAFARLVEPLMGGIYAGDAGQLSLAATFPHLRQLELTHGSLLAGLEATTAAKKPSEAAVLPPFVAFKGGMGVLVDTLLAAMPGVDFHLGVGAAVVRETVRGYEVVLADGEVLAGTAVILATPAYVTAQLVADLDPVLAEAHGGIPYASSAIVTLAYDEADLPQALDGFGYVIPMAENEKVLACTWTSTKWAGRAPAGGALIRVYIGRYGQEDVMAYDDATLVALALAELAETLAIERAPQFHRIFRWPGGMPQYNMGHLARLAQIETQMAGRPRLALAGAAYRGVGIPDCIESGDVAAGKVWV